MKHYYVYILTNKTNKVLYIGVTSNILRRIHEHKSGLINGFTKKYKTKKLVYVESFDNPNDAISNEKKIKGWLRIKKIKLIESRNPNWEDLSIKLEEVFR